MDTRKTRIIRAQQGLKAALSPSCGLCELACGANRCAGERGVCGLADETFVYRRLLHLGEEIELVPSYAVWLAGCNFQCGFCSDREATCPPFPGAPTTAQELAALIAADLAVLRTHPRNLNFVGGEPSLSLPFIADLALALIDIGVDLPPLLLNTNGYLSRPALESALDLIDIFLVDFKTSNDTCARRLGMPIPYIPVLGDTLATLLRSGRTVWIRHLLVPGHIDCCTRGVIGMLEHAPPGVRVNLMPAFVAFENGFGRLKPAELETARRLLASSSIRHRYWDGSPLD